MVNIIRSKRKTISIIIKPTEIQMRVPLRAKMTDIDRVLKEKESWIQKHLRRMQELQEAAETQEVFTAQELRELAEKAKKVIPERVRYYAELIGVDYGRITIRCQKTRWGSCTSDGNLNFNCLLLLMPDEVLDSVVVHELCHRKHMDHSKEFYEEMERILPDYQKHHKWLKEQGSLVLMRIPR